MPRPFEILLLTLCLVWSLTAGETRAGLWTQTTWEGGPGQQSWSDTARYYTDTGMDGMSSPGDLMLRYPGWEKTGELAGANAVWSIIQAEDGSLYAGTMENGDVFRSTDAGTTWVNTAELPGAWGALSVLETMDGTVYATALDGVSAKVYKTTDGGTTWLQTGDLPEVEGVYKLMQAEDGAIYASGTKHLNFPEWPGWVWKTTNGGTTWIMTSYMGDSITNVYTVFQAADRSIYAGGWGSSHAFRTTDGGAPGAGPVRRVR